jgi:hypothetical protein
MYSSQLRSITRKFEPVINIRTGFSCGLTKKKLYSGKVKYTVGKGR